MTPTDSDGGITRRRMIVAGAGTALGASVVAACGGSGSTGANSPTSGSTGSGAGGALAKVGDIPVGGAVSAKGQDGKPVIVSQPTAGHVVAFSAICTHMGCTVAPAGKILQCPCHGSTYDLATGKNTGGPAPSPLPAIQVTVKNGQVVES